MITSFKSLGQSGGGGSYVLPIASQSTLGGIKVGQNLTIDSGGTLSADAQAVSVATTATTGVVQVGSGLSITSGGVLSTDIDLSDYAKEAELSGYVQTSAMSGYVETSALTDYATNESLSAYQTTQGMSGYVQTSAMSGYQTTAAMSGYVQTSGITNIWKGSQADYDLIQTKSESTLYIIVPSEGTISVNASDTGNNEVDVIGSFSSSTYNGIYVSYIDNTVYDVAQNNGEDPDDLDWVINGGGALSTVDGNTFSDMPSVPCDGWVKIYYFLYDSTSGTVSKNVYWSDTFYGNGDCGGGGGPEEPEEE